MYMGKHSTVIVHVAVQSTHMCMHVHVQCKLGRLKKSLRGPIKPPRAISLHDNPGLCTCTVHCMYTYNVHVGGITLCTDKGPARPKQLHSMHWQQNLQGDGFTFIIP